MDLHFYIAHEHERLPSYHHASQVSRAADNPRPGAGDTIQDKGDKMLWLDRQMTQLPVTHECRTWSAHSGGEWAGGDSVRRQ